MKKDLTLIHKFIQCGSLFRIDANQYLVGWGERVWCDKLDHCATPFFYFPDFFLSQPLCWFKHENTALMSYDELINLIPSSSSNQQFSWQNPYFKHFEKSFHELHLHFEKGILKKAVPYVFEEAHQTFNPDQLSYTLFKILNFTKAQPLHVYGFWDEKEGILGASPEILFKYTGNKSNLLETVAVAGTKNNSELNNDFMNDPKERREHQLVVDGITESLSPFGVVKTGKLQVLKLPKLSHLMTPIEVEIKGSIDFESIVQVLHPTPALGAFPKAEGMNWLKSYQITMPRERYGAPLGYLLPEGKQAKCIVGIRNVQWNRHGAKIGAGCGVVPASRLANEWQEIGLKISSIKELMSL